MKIFILVILISGCGSPQYYGEMGVGHKTRPDGFEGGNPTGVFRLGADWGKYKCEIEHISHVFDGTPFNKRQEDSVEQIVCLKRFNF